MFEESSWFLAHLLVFTWLTSLCIYFYQFVLFFGEKCTQKSQFYSTASFQKRLMKHEQKRAFVYFKHELTEVVNSFFWITKNNFLWHVFFENVVRIKQIIINTERYLPCKEDPVCRKLAWFFMHHISATKVIYALFWWKSYPSIPNWCLCLLITR